MFEIIFAIVPILVVGVFIFVFVMMFSPKLRGKMMSQQIKAKYMLDEAKDDLTDIATAAGNVSIKSKKNILDSNENVLHDIATKNANIAKDGIETTVRAIKRGITGESKYCKHCGKSIDEDSKFCKECGKKQ